MANNSLFIGQGDVYGPASATDGAVALFDGTTGKLLKVGAVYPFPTTFAVGDLLYANTTTTVTGLADVAVGQVLVSGGVGVAPAYSANPTLASIVGTGGQTLALSSANLTTITNSTTAQTLRLGAGGLYAWSSATANNASPDVGISRIQAGLMGIGTGAAAS